MAAQNYYEILGVKRTASADEIQRAYRKLARKWHPDVNTEPGAEDRFKAISEANEVLSDPDMRKKYDAFGEDFRKVPDGTDPSMWNRAGRVAGDFGFGGGAAPNIEDLLGGLFKEQRDMMFGEDRFHPSAAGYANMVSVLIPAVAAALNDPEQDVIDAGQPRDLMSLGDAATQAAQEPGTQVVRSGRWASVLRRRRLIPVRS